MFLKRLSPRTLVSLTRSSFPSPYAQCSTYSTSHVTYPYSHSHPDSRNVRVSVWWDLDSCPVPLGVNAFRVPQAIQTAIKSSGIRGPIEINAFGDKKLLRTDPWVLSNTGVNLTELTQDESACESLNKSLTTWASINHPPAYVCLITVDGRSASLLHRLRFEKYNIVLASKESAPTDLSSAADMILNWDALNGVHSKSVAPVLSHDSFWTEVQTFISSDMGFFILSESSSREDMSIYLQKYGPSDVRSLTAREVDVMVDIMISEKNLVLETPSLLKPFKLNPKV